jgi:hypothetical protein
MHHACASTTEQAKHARQSRNQETPRSKAKRSSRSPTDGATQKPAEAAEARRTGEQPELAALEGGPDGPELADRAVLLLPALQQRGDLIVGVVVRAGELHGHRQTSLHTSNVAILSALQDCNSACTEM